MLNFDLNTGAPMKQDIKPIDNAVILKGLEMMYEALKKAKSQGNRYKFSPMDKEANPNKKIILPTSPLV